MSIYELSSIYEQSEDTIIAYVEADDEVKIELHMNASTNVVTIEFPNSSLDDFRAVNAFDVARQILNALYYAVRADHEIPLADIKTTIEF